MLRSNNISKGKSLDYHKKPFYDSIRNDEF